MVEENDEALLPVPSRPRKASIRKVESALKWNFPFQSVRLFLQSASSEASVGGSGVTRRESVSSMGSKRVTFVGSRSSDALLAPPTGEKARKARHPKPPKEEREPVASTSTEGPFLGARAAQGTSPASPSGGRKPPKERPASVRSLRSPPPPCQLGPSASVHCVPRPAVSPVEPTTDDEDQSPPAYGSSAYFRAAPLTRFDSSSLASSYASPTRHVATLQVQVVTAGFSLCSS